ncbi:MAG: TlpA family protein disulfide reductase [Chloroflexi bacterium]|nr:TlpA family protein disulfide reductase [Chloroflexota bacterium]
MKRVFFTLLLLTSCLTLFVGCNADGEVDGVTVGTNVGNMAPNFIFSDTDNGMTSINDMKGSPVVLNFWASWCGPCRAEMPHIQAIYNKYTEEGLYLYAINLNETTETVSAFMLEYELSFPVIMDIKQAISLNYNVSAIPITFFIDSAGVIQGKKIGAFASQESIETYLNAIL